MMQRFYSVLANTFTETVRQPIYSVILLATALLLILNVALAAFTLDDDDKLLLDLGLSTLLLSGLFLAAFSAAGVVSREIENKTVLTVISKPISRPAFITAKFVGLIAALMVAFYLSFLVFTLAERHGVLQNSTDPWDGPVLGLGGGAVLLAFLASAFCNYFYGSDFPTTMLAFVTPLLTGAVLLVAKFDKDWDVIPFASDFVGGQVMIAAFLVLLMQIIMAAVALAASTRTAQLMTLMICLCVLGLGIAADYALGQYENQSTLARMGYRVLPNFGLFWVIDGLNAGSENSTVTFEYVGYATAYALLITAGIVGIAVALFQKREVG